MTAKTNPPKAAASRTTTKTRNELTVELAQLIHPFGWQVDGHAASHLQAAELDAIAVWLADAWTKTPLAVWSVIVIPNELWIKFFKNPNDAMAIASVILHSRGEFTPSNEDPVCRLLDLTNEVEAGHFDTRFGALFVDMDPELFIWFGRKAGKTPDLFGDSARAAIHKLFNVASNEPPAKSTTKLSDVETPKSTARQTKAANLKSQISNLKSKASESTLSMILLSDILPAADNHRKTFDKIKLQELADSIKQHGLLQPLLLRLRPDADPPYQIIAGERRFRAAKLAGLDRVPAQIIERDGLAGSLAMLEENIRREDLSPIERANAIRSLMDSHGLTQKQVGEMIGVTQGQVSNELRLLGLPPTLQMEVASGAIAPTLIRSVLPYTDLPDVLENMTAALLSDGGPYTEDCITEYLGIALSEASRSMDFQATWQAYQNPDPKRRHFEEVSKLDLKLLAVRKVDAVTAWNGQERTFNVELFDTLNAAPLAARKKKHAAWKAKNKVVMTTPSNGKSKSAAIYFESDYKLEDAIETDLQRLLADAIERSKDKAAALRVVLAFAVATEGTILQELAGRVYNSDATRAVIDKLTGNAADMYAALRTAVLTALRSKNYSQSAEESYCYAAVLGIKLWEHWNVTPEVLAVLTDSGRAEFVDKEPGHIPDFLRPFLKLDVDEPKAKKTKAA